MKMTINKRLSVPIILLLTLLIVSEGISQERFGGMTLYTVRDAMGTDPKGTLEEVSKLGYKYIEATEYKDGKFYGMTPKAFKKQLKKLKLVPLSTHQSGLTLSNADTIIADAKAVGFKYIVIPVPPMGMFTFDRRTMTLGMKGELSEVTDFLTTVGEKCKVAGLKLLYHNHDFEYKENSDGIVPIEYFLENTDPELVNFQMDLYWVTKAKASPVKYFEKYPGRFKIWHVKDMDSEGRFAPVGTGTIDFAEILAQKELSGMEYYIVEQDQTFDIKPLEAIKISREGLKKFGFQ